MKITTGWIPALLLALAAAVAGTPALAQSDAAATASDDAASMTSSSDDAAASSSGDAASGTMVTRGAPDDAGGAQSGPSQSGISEISQEPPPAAIAPRPSPTPDQIEALRLLEDEVHGFAERGEGFRQSVNGILRREHETQIARLRSGFERQIQAEREAETIARRHAIEVFERFLELYPDDPDHTPDVMFRLAELYYDESYLANLDAVERTENERQAREAQGAPTDDLQTPPVDYRCSILLYRHVARRFPHYRLSDATHYLLGWVLKEMNHNDESITSYRGLVCPQHFHYAPRMDLAASLMEGRETPVMCPHTFDILRPYGADLITPPGSPPAPDGSTAGVQPEQDFINDSLHPPVGPVPDGQPLPIPSDYADCTALPGANGQPSRYAGEVWYYIGDYHFDDPPSRNPDLGSAYAIAAYRAAMKASEIRRPAGAPANTVVQPAAGLQGADTSPTGQNMDPSMSNTGSGVTAANSPGRAQFSPDIEYSAFWSKALYKVGWSYFKMLNGYPDALKAFALLMDYYDWSGTDENTQGSRRDTLRWIGVIFSESTWGLQANNDGVVCQDIVNAISRPPQEARNIGFDCAGIIRILSPLNAMSIYGARDDAAARLVRPTPGRPAYIPYDRPWTPEAYLELANNYFTQTKYYEAITLYRIFLKLYPLHFQAPRVAENIARSYEAQRQYDEAIAARGQLANYTEHSAWWDANNSHPEAQRYAEMIARNSLHDNAIQHHQHAFDLHQRGMAFRRCAAGAAVENVCEAARNPRERADLEARATATLEEANREYGVAVEAYGRFIQSYPQDEDTYSFRYYRADALFWSEHYHDAARAYQEVRESNENDRFLTASAYMVVKSLETDLQTQAAAGRLDPCIAIRAGVDPATIIDPNTHQPRLDEDAAKNCQTMPTQPPPAGSNAQPTVTQINLPDEVREAIEARVAYMNRVPRATDSIAGLHDVVSEDPAHAERNPPFRPKFAYINARTLLRFGYLQDAETRLRAVIQAFCGDPVVARAAVEDLRNIFVIQGRTQDLVRLATAQQGHACAGVAVDVFQADLTDAAFHDALDLFHRAEHGSGAEALQLYEQAANAMRDALARNRNHPQAPLALYYTALAYERTNRFDSATQTYVRITNEYNNLNVVGSNPPRPLEGPARQERINVLEVSNFNAGVNLERTFDHDAAVRYFNNVVHDERFSTAEHHDEHVHDALSAIAVIQTNLGNWDAAQRAWQEFLPRADAGREAATVRFRIGEMPFRAQRWGDAVTSLQRYRREVPMGADTAEFHVLAQYDIAQAYRSQNNNAAYARELRNVSQVYAQSGSQPGSRAATFAAEARFRDVDQQLSAFMQRTFTRGSGTQLRAQIDGLAHDLDTIDTDATATFMLLGGEYSIAALERDGEAHEYFANQIARVMELVQPSAQQRASVQRLTAQADHLEQLAGRIEAANADSAQRLRDQAQQIRDQLQTLQDQQNQQLQQSFDQTAAEHRQIAIRRYALAIFLARSAHIPTQFAARSLENLRHDELRDLIDAAVEGIPADQRSAIGFNYTPGMFNSDAPGADVTQETPVATPGLAGE